jgi:hypothetical protein
VVDVAPATASGIARNEGVASNAFAMRSRIGRVGRAAGPGTFDDELGYSGELGKVAQRGWAAT